MQNTKLTIIEEKTDSRGRQNRNRKKILLVGGFAAVAIGGCALYMNRSTIGALVRERIARLANLTNATPKVTICQTSAKTVMLNEPDDIQNIANAVQSINVSEHIRNLSGGRTPSLQKVETALQHNFVLDEHQTWVESYTKNVPYA